MPPPATTLAAKSPELVLGDFVVGDLLGQGGFATVFHAEQRGLGRPAVVKLFRGSLAGRGDAQERFALEARLAARFDHPYAAHIYAFGAEPDGRMWIAMELVKGTPLDEVIKRTGPIPIERLVVFVERLCEVIQAAHDQGIVHRDIKPSNVMVTAHAGRLLPKLLDFGIAKLVATQVETGIDATPTLSLRPGVAAPRHAADAHAFDVTVPDAPASGSLTATGQILGTPAYMAPEQWVDGPHVGPWTDQYALGILIYEALTAMRPYAANTIEALAEQHLYEPLPALPSHVPPAVHAVIARATAKEPRRRYPSLTELATAFRDAVHGPEEPRSQPIETLSTVRRNAWIAGAPRPIAESIAALAAASSSGQVAERISIVASLLARWLGVLSIAGRSHLGRLGANTADDLELLRALRRRPLHDLEWLELATALARPFADRPETCPVPELARFLADDAAATLRALMRTDAALVLLDDAMSRRIAERLAQLDAVLEALAWLLDYEVAREGSDGLEVWTGVRTDARVVRPIGCAASGAVVLLDADGIRALRLSPLVQIAAPARGHADELFVVAGPSHAGAARLCAYPRGFELEDDAVWAWLAEHVVETSAPAAAHDDADRAPYPGLRAYTAADRDSYVGRERDIAELINRLRTQSCVAVAGPSGIGKSSLLAAGVIPALPAGWEAITIRPGADPLTALRTVVDRVDAPPYRDHLRATTPAPIPISSRLVAAAEHRAATLVVIVDQAEELFTMCGDADNRAAFAEALAAASASPHVRIVLGIRDDFLCRAEELPAWRGVLARGVHVLLVPSQRDLERVVTAPAIRHGFSFDDPTLPAAIAAEVAERPGALPLLAFAAAELWERRDRHFHRLTRAAYDAIGGVAGALVQHADGVVDRMPAADRRLVRHAFRLLLTADGTRASLSRDELVAGLGGSHDATAVIERLLAARLVVSRDDDDGERIEIIHETLASTWPRLAGWRRDDAASARFHERLRAAARHWEERGRPPGLLWRGDALDELRGWRSADISLSPVESAFVAASTVAARRARRHRFAAIAAGFGVLALGVVGLTWANHRITAQHDAAVGKVAAGFADRGRQSLEAGDASHAALYLAEAARFGARGPGLDLMVAFAESSLAAQDRVIAWGTPPIGQATIDARTILALNADGSVVAWDRDGRATPITQRAAYATLAGDRVAAVTRDGTVEVIDRRGVRRWQVARAHDGSSPLDLVATAAGGGVVASYGPTARLWRLDDGAPIAELRHDAPVTAAGFDAAAARVATGDDAGGVRVWDAASGRLIATCPANAGRVTTVAFAPDGTRVVSAGADRDVRVCDAQTGAEVHRLIGHRGAVVAVAFGPDGVMVTGSADGTARLWELASGRPSMVLEVTRGAVSIARFSPDGSRLLTAGSDGTARIWTRDGALLGALEGHAGRILGGAWDGDDAVITTSLDGTIRRWRVERAIRGRRTVPAPGATIADMTLSRDDRWLVTAGGKTVRIRDRAGDRDIARLELDAAVTAVIGAPDSRAVLTLDGGGRARVWSMPAGTPVATLAASNVDAAIYIDAATIATAGGDGAVRLWRADGQPIATIPTALEASALIVDPSGRWLVATDPWEQERAAVIDLAARRQVRELRGDAAITAVAIDGTHLAMSDDDAIRTWSLGTWSPVAAFDGHAGSVTDLWFLSDGSLVSAGDDAKLLVWYPAGTLRASLDTGGGAVLGFAASPDHRLFATVGRDGALRVWDPATFQHVLVLRAHSGRAGEVAFTRDGTELLSGGRDGVVVAWDITRPTRSAAELATLVRCHVPLGLVGDVALPRTVDLADTSCR